MMLIVIEAPAVSRFCGSSPLLAMSARLLAASLQSGVLKLSPGKSMDLVTTTGKLGKHLRLGHRTTAILYAPERYPLISHRPVRSIPQVPKYPNTRYVGFLS